jgi:predicted HTH transcriptional regulator
MALNIDPTRRPMRPSDWDAVAQAVLNADPTDETDWIEWKGALDLGTRQGKFKVARAILGFANRDTARALRNLVGHALIVVGVEPGKVHGAEQLDGADLEGRLEPYLGSDGPDWECHYRPVANQHVLVICVRPPLPSDPIYTLRKSLDRNWAGTVFIRRGSKTVPADDKELAMLQRRLLAGQPSTSIDGLIAVERSHDDGDLEIPRCDVDERDLQPVIRCTAPRAVAVP